MLKEQFLCLIKDELLEVENLLHNLIVSESQEISLIYNHTLKAGGKRFRPALMLLCGKVFSNNKNGIITLSAASELIHMASLIHDDVIDDNSLRRGILTANYRWGNKMSVLAADYVLLNVLAVLLKEFNSYIIAPLFHAVSRMCEGELLQIRATYDFFIKESEYIKIIEYKTASLMAACCEVVARVSNADERAIKSMYEYGRAIGIAFQIIDDLMDLTCNSLNIGKNSGNDLREGKITLPVIRYFECASNSDCNKMIDLIRAYSKGDSTLEEVLNLINHYGGIDYSRKKALSYLQSGLEHLDFIKNSKDRLPLEEIGSYIISRVN